MCSRPGLVSSRSAWMRGPLYLPMLCLPEGALTRFLFLIYFPKYFEGFYDFSKRPFCSGLGRPAQGKGYFQLPPW